MRIAVTTQGNDLGAQIDSRFGRAPKFLVLDTETMRFDVVANSQSLDLSQGAGIQSAQNVLAHKPDVVLTGNCGPKAFRVLKAAGIKVVTGAPADSPESLVRQYLSDSLVTEASVCDH